MAIICHENAIFRHKKQTGMADDQNVMFECLQKVSTTGMPSTEGVEGIVNSRKPKLLGRRKSISVLQVATGYSVNYASLLQNKAFSLPSAVELEN